MSKVGQYPTDKGKHRFIPLAMLYPLTGLDELSALGVCLSDLGFPYSLLFCWLRTLKTAASQPTLIAYPAELGLILAQAATALSGERAGSTLFIEVIVSWAK